MKKLICVLFVLAAAAFAADINGTWKATAEGPQGAIERTFVFKTDGSKLTGETNSSFTGESTITDGKVDGDNLSFTITANIQGNEVKLSYKGKVTSANEMHLTSDFGGQSIEWVAKKQ